MLNVDQYKATFVPFVSPLPLMYSSYPTPGPERHPLPVTAPVAFIIGAGSHIGAALASKLYTQGYRVALGSRRAVTRPAPPYFSVQVDASQAESLTAAFATVIEQL